MEELTRRDFGFEDDVEGYVYLKHGEPAVQLHLGEGSYGPLATVFWRSFARPRLMLTYFGRMLEDAARLQEGHSRFRPHHASATYVLHAGESARHEIELPEVRLVGDWLVGLDRTHFFPYADEQVEFVRYDAVLRTPLIVWGDTYGGYYAELGVTCALWPDSMFEFIQITRPDLDEYDLMTLRNGLEQHLGEHAWAIA